MPGVHYIDPAGMNTGASSFSTQEQQILQDVNDKIAARPSLAAMVEFVFARTRTIHPCDRIGLAFLLDDGHIVAHHAAASYSPLLLKAGYAEDIDTSSLKQVLASGALRIIDDLEAYAAAKPASPSTRLLVQEGVRSSLTCPLVLEGRPIGFLFRSSHRPNAYTAKHAALHLATAARLTQAVDTARRIEQLEHANRAYREMLGFVAHELKSPLSTMLMQAGVLNDGLVGPLNGEQSELMERMIAAGEFLQRMIEDYLNLARVDSGDLQLSPRKNVDFHAEILTPCIDMIDIQREAKGMNLQVEFDSSNPPVTVDTGLMLIVVNNLLSNAVKYGAEGKSVTIAGRVDDQGLHLTVRNDGPGFTVQQRSRLFRRFSRIDSPELMKQKGTGVGLYTTYRIIKLHGGSIRADSEPGKWAAFSLIVPQPLTAN